MVEQPAPATGSSLRRSKPGRPASPASAAGTSCSGHLADDRQLASPAGPVRMCCRGAAGGVGEDGAQAFVAIGHVAERRLQRGHVQVAGQPQRQRHVVDRAGAFQLVEEPHPLLPERQRHRLRARLPGPAAPGPGQPPRRAGRCRPGSAVNRPRIGISASSTARTRAISRIASSESPAQLEEAILGPDPLQPQHLGEQATDDLLARGPRLPADQRRAELRRGQRGPVQLPVGRQRQRHPAPPRRRAPCTPAAARRMNARNSGTSTPPAPAGTT